MNMPPIHPKWNGKKKAGENGYKVPGDLGPKNNMDAIIEAATRTINPNTPQAINPLARIHF